MMKIAIPILFSLIFAISINAQEANQYKMAMSKPVQFQFQMNYLCYFPENFNQQSDQLYPLLIFLHGSGERGSDLEKVMIQGPPALVEKQPFPAIVVSPQCAPSVWWDVFELNKFLDQLIRIYPVDTTRIYLTGLSMGGYGTWEWATRHPERFAAIVPVCGSGNVHRAERLVNVPIWAFHGAKDDVVPPEKSIEMVEAINKLGGNVKFTLYPEANHNSWTETYNNPEMWNWLWQQHK